MSHRRDLFGPFAILAAITLLAGCSGGGSASGPASYSAKPTGAVQAWGFDNADEVGTSRVAYAKREFPKIAITLDKTPFDAQKFTTRIASGNVPDVVQMDRNFVATYAAQGLIQPLDRCFSAHDVAPSKSYYPSVVSDVTYDGHIWGVPQFFQPPAILANTAVLDAAGIDWTSIDTSKPDQLVALAKQGFKADGGTPALLGFDPVTAGQLPLWILGYGGQIVDSKGRPTLDDAANAKGLTVLKELNDAQGGYAKVKSFSDGFDSFGDGNQFVKGQVGAQVDAQWYVNVLSPYASKISLRAIPFKDSRGRDFTVAGGTAFVIPAGAKNADAACAWATSLTSLGAWEAAGAARQKTIESTPGSINTGLFTGSPKADQVVRQKYVKSSGNAGFDQTISTFYDIVDDGTSIGASPAGQQIQTELATAAQAVMLDQKSPAAALKAAQAAAMRAYDRSTNAG